MVSHILNVKNPLALISLAIVLISVLLSIYWLWGLLMLVWVLLDVRQQKTWLSETITREENPQLYFAILGCWLIIGLYFSSELLTYIK